MDVVRRVRGFAWAALRMEVSLYLALGRWITRRPDVPDGTALQDSSSRGAILQTCNFAQFCSRRPPRF